MRKLLPTITLPWLLAMSPIVCAQGIVVGSGGSINVGGGSISLGCKDVQIDGELLLGSGSLESARHIDIAGTLNGQSGAINLSGNWTNLGTVNAGTSAVSIEDNCDTTESTVSGNTTFYDWSVVTASARQLNFAAGDTQSVTNSLVFDGAAGNVLRIRSTVPDTPGILQLAESGSQFVDHVDVKDNHAPMPGQFMAPGFPEDYNSIDSGGNFRWFGSFTFTITVYKDFNDGNSAEVLVTKDCNTGLPLNVITGILEGGPKTFVTTSIISGETNCSVTETVPDGYSVAYATEPDGETNPNGCEYTNIEQGSELECFIFNTIDPVEVNVRKLWFDEYPEFQNPMLAEAFYECTGEAELDDEAPSTSGELWFLGDDSFDTFQILPHWNGLTSCTVTEQVSDLSVEVDDSECEVVSVQPGQSTDPTAGDYDCTIYNTRYYEGIPTLSQYGLLILSLLMLLTGITAVRRFT